MVITSIMLLSLAFLLIEVRSCAREVNKLADERHGKTIKADTVVKYHYVTKWLPGLITRTVKRDSIIYPPPAVVDTLAILKKFYAEYCYQDTIKDTNIIAVSDFTISENRLKDHRFTYKILLPSRETIITRTTEKPAQRHLLFGAAFSVGENNYLGLGPELLYISRQQHAYGIGYDLLNKSYSVKALIPLKFK
jgi:hypothetical protein